ncbi:superoxide dismutase family protein [Novosphingopyxis sp.]|uniref:superoxide dismutase family protein n=1 Tax=Novosphingopyxis sp. TaxID=2709690 RepID=UPI003B591339
MRNLIIIGAAASTLALSACQKEPADDADQVATVPAGSAAAAGAGPQAIAMLKTADGRSVGEVKVIQDGNGLNLMLDVNGLPQGNHGIHIHSVGKCDAPDFESAGGHWNPTDKHHGVANDAGPHLGDFVNLEVVSDGTGHLERPILGATLEGGPNALLDADGAAFIVHAGKDDQMSDPSGNSGARLACGVFTKAGSL